MATETLKASLIRRIEEQGPMPFSEYMSAALYQPELGYYQQKKSPIGKDGDFITAPELSFVFAHCLTSYLHDALAESLQQPLLEIGAGNGAMAADLLDRLLWPEYHIIERSVARQSAQQYRLSEYAVKWLDELPKQGQYIVLANEVIDAMPAERWRQKAGVWERCFVNVHEQTLYSEWRTETLPETLQSHLSDWPESKEYLYPVGVDQWLHQLAECSTDVILIDYGDTISGLKQLPSNGIRCYRQHQQHLNMYEAPGMDDLTFDVDFSYLMSHPEWQVTSFYRQSDFLMQNGLSTLPMDTLDEVQKFTVMQSVKQLMFPDQMGEIFKLLHLSKRSHGGRS